MKTILTLVLLVFTVVSCSKKKDDAPAPGPGPDMTAPAMDPEPAMNPEPAMPAEVKPEPAMVTEPKAAPPKAVEIPVDAVVVEAPLWHQTFTVEGEKYFALNSSKYQESKNLKGYGAPIELVVVFDEAGTVSLVKVANHKETPEFMDRIEKEWLPGLLGLTKDKPILGTGGVDALTEATVSTDAIRKTVDELRKLAFTQLLKLELPSPAAPAAAPAAPVEAP